MLKRPVSRVHARAPALVIRLMLSKATHWTPAVDHLAEARAHLVGRESSHGALDGDVELGARPVCDVHRAGEDDARSVEGANLPLAFLHFVGRLPCADREGRARREVQTVLAALGSEPEAIFAAVVVERRTGLAGFEEGTVHEPEARAVEIDRARHHTPLPSRAHGDDAAARRLEDLDRTVRAQKRDVVFERSRLR